MNTNTQNVILRRVLAPERGELAPEAARYFLSLDFPQADHKRMAELATRANAGMLTPEEQAEIKEYGRVADLLALLQSKARKSLKEAGAVLAANGQGP